MLERDIPSWRLAVLALCVGLGGCTATSFQSSNPAYRLQAEPQDLPAAVPGSARVAVRWTQATTPAAQDLLRQYWVNNYNRVIWNNPLGISESDSRPQAYQEIAPDSAYYAAEFARLLARRMPAADIVLEPLALDVQDGRYVYRPLVRNRFPAQMVVDLWVAPNTFSAVMAYMRATFSVSTAGLASAPTCGVLAFQPVSNIMPESGAADCAALEARDVPHPDLIHGFSSSDPKFSASLPLKPGVPLEPGLAVGYPLTYETFTSAYLEKSGEAGFNAGQDLNNPTLEDLAKTVADGLSHIDAALSTQVAWGSYVGLYDPQLAQRLRAGPVPQADMVRLQFIAKLADAERAWVAVQDQAVLERMLDGEFGKSFRATRLAMDKAYNRQQMMGWASMLTMAGAGLASGALGGAGSGMAGLQANMTAMQTAVQYMADAQQSSQAFYQQFGSEMAARQHVAEIDYGGKVVRVQADNLDKLYTELGRLYQARFGAAAAGKTASRK
ncbi:hypothetical protein KDH83_04340 [Achromobacter sp. Marseille-Q0513]|uniref:hypothetical protein n=1 Tax=Achromobacter sp. Marseille-Q0513 TaxID=2829161 RepID=UPI001B93C24C|nr:hypothetical protein [Achromobacter sp. Marseille-Q0513]MBR8652538.1 hypothetical protein [Achromobacter sp. Marseille-Q0513]